MKIKLLLLFLLFFFSHTSFAQEATEKKALIKELLVTLEADKTPEEIFNATFNQMEKILPNIFLSEIENDPHLAHLEAGEREEVKRRINESMQNTQKRFKELFKQRVNLAEITEQISYSLYAKFFTEDELKDLISFYKSPTGKKSTKILPELISESLQKTNEILEPLIRQIIDQVIKEEKNRLFEK